MKKKLTNKIFYKKFLTTKIWKLLISTKIKFWPKKFRQTKILFEKYILKLKKNSINQNLEKNHLENKLDRQINIYRNKIYSK